MQINNTDTYRYTLLYITICKKYSNNFVRYVCLYIAKSELYSIMLKFY